MAYLEEIKGLQNTFRLAHLSQLKYVPFNGKEWEAVLSYYFQPNTQITEKPALTSFLSSFHNVFKGDVLAEDLAKFLHEVYLIAAQEYNFEGRDVNLLPNFQRFCADQMQPFYDKGVSEKVFTQTIHKLCTTHDRKDIIQKAVGTDNELLDVLFDHSKDIDAIAAVIRKKYLTQQTVLELYQLLESTAGTCPNIPLLNEVNNRYRLYAALRQLNDTTIKADLLKINSQHQNQAVKKVLEKIKEDPKPRRIPYFAAPAGADPLINAPQGQAGLMKFNLVNFIKRNKKPLIWAIATFVLLTIAVLLPVSLAIIAPFAFSTKGLPALFLTLASTIIPNIVYKNVKAKHEDEIAYLEAQDEAQSMPELSDEELTEKLNTILNLRLNSEEDENAVTLNTQLSRATDSSLVKNIFNAIHNPKVDIYTIADEFKKCMKNEINIILLFNISRFMNTQENSIITYRFQAAFRLAIQDPQVKLEAKNLNNSLKEHENHFLVKSIISTIKHIEASKNPPALERMQKAAYPAFFIPSKNEDPLYALALGNKAPPMATTQIFSKEWFTINQKPLFYAAVAAAAVLGCASMVFTFGLAAIPAAVAGMGVMTAGSLTITLSGIAGLLGFAAGKIMHKEEMEILDIKYGQAQEMKLMDKAKVDAFSPNSTAVLNQYKQEASAQPTASGSGSVPQPTTYQKP